MEFWHELQIKKSFELLMELKKEFDFILIGGWAVYLYTRALKSKDIDLIVDYGILEKLRAKYDVVKNERLKKYETKLEGIDIDIYLPFYSNPGIPAEEIKGIPLEGFKVPPLEVLLILKQNAYRERMGSIKGEKDKLDIISILKKGIDLKLYQDFLKHYQRENFREELIQLLKKEKEAKELNLNQSSFSRLRKKVLAGLANS
jgi:hypothetical protein